MTPKTQAQLKGFTDYFGLEIVSSDKLPDKVPGLLASTDGPIILNARRPPLEHAFTIAHELGHYIMHQKGERKFPLPSFLYRRWKWRWIRTITRQVKAVMLAKFDKEWEADFWAFVMLWHIGAVTEVMFIFESYPEKRTLYWLSIFAFALGVSRRLEKNLPLLPLRVAGILQSTLSRGRSRDN